MNLKKTVKAMLICDIALAVFVGILVLHNYAHVGKYMLSDDRLLKAKSIVEGAEEVDRLRDVSGFMIDQYTFIKESSWRHSRIGIKVTTFIMMIILAKWIALLWWWICDRRGKESRRENNMNDNE